METTLKEGKLYHLGKDCPYGYYLVVSKSLSSDAYLKQYTEYPPISSYRRSSCYFCCEKVSLPEKIILIENGDAAFFGDKPLSLYDNVSNVCLESGHFLSDGIELFSNELCTIKTHYVNNEKYIYSGEIDVHVTNQQIYSINDRFFWKLSIDVKSFKNYRDIEISLVNTFTGECVLYGKDGFGYQKNDEISYSVSDKSLKYIATPRNSFFVMEMPIGCNPKDMVINWIQPSNTSRKCYLTSNVENNKRERERQIYKSILERYIELGIDLNVEKEMAALDEAPDFTKICSEFLFEQLDIAKMINIEERDKNLRFTFHVDTIYNKSYYIAAKIAEKAVEITTNENKNAYHITFDGTQIEEITLMYYNLLGEYDGIDDRWNYIKKHDFCSYLVSEINGFIASYNEEYGYSGYLTNSILIHIVKSINKAKRQKLDDLYAEMIRERRVTTKWGSEYTLFSLVQNYVSDAVYQYRPSWLGAQSFDIFLPSSNVAIEYQGQQHYEPIDVFGGEASLKDNQERDERKRRLSRENGVKVLDWKYTVPVNERNVRQFLNNNGIEILRNNTTNTIHSIESNTLDMAPVQQNNAKNKKQNVQGKKISTVVIRQYNTDGSYINQFDTIKEAVKQTGVSEKSIKNVIYGYRRSGGGYLWKRCDISSAIEDIEPPTLSINTGKGKPVIQIGLDGNIIASFPSMNAAASAVGIDARGISDVLSGKQKTAGGFFWKYDDDNS